jgi:hypothetical protein
MEYSQHRIGSCDPMSENSSYEGEIEVNHLFQSARDSAGTGRNRLRNTNYATALEGLVPRFRKRAQR